MGIKLSFWEVNRPLYGRILRFTAPLRDAMKRNRQFTSPNDNFEHYSLSVQDTINVTYGHALSSPVLLPSQWMSKENLLLSGQILSLNP